MSGQGSGTPDRGFQDRINRVQERRAPIEASRPQVDLLPDWKENIRYPASLIGAAFLGMFAVFFARFARFHLMGGTLSGEAPDLTMIIDAGLAVLAALVIFGAIGMTLRESDRAERHGFFSIASLGGNPVKLAIVVGVAIMIGTMHNMVHSAPKAFSVVFSPEWAADVVEFSAPGSIYYRGNYFVVFPQTEAVAEDVDPTGDGAEEKVLPKVRRL